MPGVRGTITGWRRRVSRAALLAVLLTGVAGACSPERDEGAKPPGSQPTTRADLEGADLWLTFEDDTVAHDGGVTYADALGGPYTAKVVTANDGKVEAVPGADESGTAVAFPAKCTQAQGCPRAMLEIAADPALDPGEATFEYGATVWLAADQTTHGSNILQKGRFGTDGGQWKLQVDSFEGQPSCVVRGNSPGSTPVVVASQISISDSEWHRVVCRREGDTVSIDVDGKLTTKQGPTGSVTNEWPVRVGSPGVGDADDQFSGRVDDVFLSIDPPQ
jgi:hypothetical protein